MTERSQPVCPAPLDPGFSPAILAHRAQEARLGSGDSGVPLVLAVEREEGLMARFETRLPEGPLDGATAQWVDRLAKFLLWASGGWRLYAGGPVAVGEQLRRAYAPGGERAFDAELWERVYERPFEVVACKAEEAPAAREQAAAIGGQLDGCRIGFDLGASDFKLAAVKDGEAVFSTEIPWDPRPQSDPGYHYGRIQEGLKLAASHLPRVDAIGGSSAGVYVNSRPMVASLFRAVPRERYRTEVLTLFERLRAEWKVPFVVINDGDVTALAGGLSLGEPAVLGLAMGSSEAVGYLDPNGRITGRQNELAFAPVDFQAGAPPDEWSGDRGVGALYFSQQAVNKLAPAAGLRFPDGMGLPERLLEVQRLMAAEDPRALAIYETIGVYLGYTVPWYRVFYDFRHLLVLGRVTSGPGGDLILAKAREILASEFPEVAAAVQLHTPDEKMKRVGQAVAAASLPRIG